jgi:hypothetical protein
MPSAHHRRLLLLLLTVLCLFFSRRPTFAQDEEVFTVTPAGGGSTATPGEEIDFAVNDPQPDRTYVWSFGDDSPPVTGERVTHRFANVDDYTVFLDVVIGGRQERAGERLVRVAPELLGVFASDADDQITPADEFQLAVAVRSPGLAGLALRIGGPLVLPRSAEYQLGDDLTWMLLDDVRTVSERDELIVEQLLAKPGAAIPLSGGRFTLALEYTTTKGRRVSLTFEPEVRDFHHPDQVIELTFPRITAFAGLPPEGAGTDDYYLLGNPDFSHVDDLYVRRLALEWGRRGGVWPDDPQQVATNIFRTIDALFGDGDPGLFNNDYNLARLFEDGSLSRTRRNGDYICIAQAYLFSALARTLGIPAREINNAVGAPARQRPDGVWQVAWWQEAGVELWYHGAWHYFDTWLGVTDRSAYLGKNLIYQTWATFDRQNTEFRTVRGEATGMRGHNFSAWPGDPPQWEFLEEKVRPGVVVDGMVGDPPAAPITRAPQAAEYSGSSATAGDDTVR